MPVVHRRAAREIVETQVLVPEQLCEQDDLTGVH